MTTFFIGLLVLCVGGFFYSFLCEKIFKPNVKSKTPAFYKKNNVDYIPIPA
jgi:carbon starvation protein CstA